MAEAAPTAGQPSPSTTGPVWRSNQFRRTGADLESGVLGEVLADDASQQLTGLVIGQLVAGHDALRRARRAQALLHEFPQLVRADLAPAPDHDRHGLAPLLVGHADHRAVLDAGVLDQHVLDLAGRHVLAAAHDDVVGAALEEDVAVVVDPTA